MCLSVRTSVKTASVSVQKQKTSYDTLFVRVKHKIGFSVFVHRWRWCHGPVCFRPRKALWPRTCQVSFFEKLQILFLWFAVILESNYWRNGKNVLLRTKANCMKPCKVRHSNVHRSKLLSILQWNAALMFTEVSKMSPLALKLFDVCDCSEVRGDI